MCYRSRSQTIIGEMIGDKFLEMLSDIRRSF